MAEPYATCEGGDGAGGATGTAGACSSGTVSDLVRVEDGQNNLVYFGRDDESGAQVVVKIEGAPGRLNAECRALAWATSHGVPVPGLLRHGAIRINPMDPAAAHDAGGPGRRFGMVMERLHGDRPHTPDHWRTMGAVLSSLAEVPWAGSGLDFKGPGAFVEEHRGLHRTLVAELPAPFGAALDLAVTAAGAEPPAELAPQVLTHGDPGPGNFVLCADGGHLLDWETAQIAPRGLDPARAAFLGLLNRSSDTDATAYARACSVWTGYAEAAERQPAAWHPSPGMIHWWMSVAALQFIANRWRRRGEPRILPWQAAVTTLALIGRVTDGVLGAW